MKQAHRVYIASPDARNLEKLLGSESRFFIIGSGDGGNAVRDVFRLCPDALVLDSVLSGLDGAEALRGLQKMPTPPRVVVLARGPVMGESGGADVLCPYPCTAAQFISAVSMAAERPLPALAAPWEEERLAAADRLLDALAVPEGLKGRACMRWAAAALACAPQLGRSYQEGLYPYVARQCGSTPRAVERALRTAVESTWLRGNLDAIQALFGLSVDAERGKPTNAECLSMLSDHVRRETARRMAAEARPVQ